jgi:hypothetical protein
MTEPSHTVLPTWTPEREARALRLFLYEGFTAAEVADALGDGFSRAAVIGKVRRLGFRKRDVVGKPPRRTAIASVCSPGVESRLPPQRPLVPLPPLREVEPTGSPSASLSCHRTRAVGRLTIRDPAACTLRCSAPGQPHTVPTATLTAH